MTIDQLIKQAAKHFSITKDGELSRDSTPYMMSSKTKMGVGFDTVSEGYRIFKYRLTPSVNQRKIKSHRMVFFLLNGYLPPMIDHIDRDGLNNHPDNLRVATRSQNNMNRQSYKGSSSKFLGVSWHKDSKKWQTRIHINCKQIHLGYFTNEREAASHYNLAAMEHHGEFANLNDVR